MTADADADAVRHATRLVAGHLNAAMAVLLVDLGHRLGLFEAAAGQGPLTPAQLAAGAGCDERNVEEWLGAMVTAGLFRLGASPGTVELPDAMSAVLTGDGPENLARLAAQPVTLAGVVPLVAEAMRTGSGVPYEAYRPAFTATMDSLSGPLFEHCSLEYLACAGPAVVDRLRRQGGRALDVGCGTGRFTLRLADELPLVEAVGVDLDADAVGAAAAEAERRGLANARFVVGDAAALPPEPPWDLVTAFDTVHDQADPAGLLAAIRAALAPGGVFVMVDVKAETGLEGNAEHPMGPWLYGISTLHCLQVSLAGGGPGLGTAWGRERARALLDQAGFSEVEEQRVARDRANVVYVARP